MIARMSTQKDQIMKEYSLFGGPDRLQLLRDIIMRGDLSGKRSRTPARQRGFSAEKKEDTSQDPMEDNDTCTARQLWKGGDLPVPEPDSWVTMDSAYGFDISRPASKMSSRTIRRPVRVSFASVDDAPEAFPCPIICRCVCEDYDPWLWQPLPVPSTWTWDATSSYRQDWSQCPAAMEADTFPCFLGLPHPDCSWTLSETLNPLSNYPQERRLAHANSEVAAPLSMDEDMSQDPLENNDTCTARQFWKGYDLPVPEPDSWVWVSVDCAYGFCISRPASKTSSWTIRRPVRVSFASVDDAPEAFPCPLICRCVCEDYDPWLWQPLPGPSTWTWDATCSYRPRLEPVPCCHGGRHISFFPGTFTP